MPHCFAPLHCSHTSSNLGALDAPPAQHPLSSHSAQSLSIFSSHSTWRICHGLQPPRCGAVHACPPGVLVTTLRLQIGNLMRDHPLRQPPQGASKRMGLFRIFVAQLPWLLGPATWRGRSSSTAGAQLFMEPERVCT